MAAPALSIATQHAERLADPALREALLKYARRRLPHAEVDDLVQNTLTEALISANPPGNERDFQRWVHGIARHKVADLYRRRGRSPLLDPELDDKVGSNDSGPATGELSQWIERELPKTNGAHATLHWLLREGEGETLDEIARGEALPAPRVRQRVSRLRRHLHSRWLALGAAGLGLLLYAGASIYRGLPQKSAEISKDTLQHVEATLPRPAVPSVTAPSAPAGSPPPISQLGGAKSGSVEHTPPTQRLPKQKAAPHRKLAPHGKPAPLPQSAPSEKPVPGKTLSPTKSSPANNPLGSNAAPQQLSPERNARRKGDPTQNFDPTDFPAQQN